MIQTKFTFGKKLEAMNPIKFCINVFKSKPQSQKANETFE